MTIIPLPKLVIVESPFRATAHRTQEQHRAYLLHALADCYKRGESPFASHHLTTEVLDDDTPYERALGIRCGLAWGQHADLVAVYSDLGVSPGMKEAIDHYKSLNKPIEWRSLPDRIVRAIRDMGDDNTGTPNEVHTTPDSGNTDHTLYRKLHCTIESSP